MKTDNTNPEDLNKDPRGEIDPPENKTLSYEAHQKLLNEKKAGDLKLREAQDKLDALEAEKASAAEQTLKDQNKWEEAYQLKTQELDQKNQKLDLIEEERTNAKKLNSFFEALGGRVDKKYWNLIDIDKIKIEDGQINEFSVSTYVDEFKTNFSEVVGVKDARRMPTGQPPANGAAGKITYEQWLQLPLKEKDSRQGDVI